LRRFPEFKEWMARSSAEKNFSSSESRTETASVSQDAEAQTPRERIDKAKQELESALQEDLLQRVRRMEPSDFEDLILRLLLAMRYGQGIEEMARVLGGSSDGGVDGAIHQDPLGLERVYIQAKRWKDNNKVGPHEIRDFIGALHINKPIRVCLLTLPSSLRKR
jgi:restriction system protein